MSDTEDQNEDENAGEAKNLKTMGSSPDTAQLIYILYLSSIFLGATAPIGLIMAYMNKESAPEWLQTHYVFLVNTFWKGLLYMVISFVLMFVVIGFLTILVAVVWWVVRSVKGLKLLSKQEPIPDPKSWLF